MSEWRDVALGDVVQFQRGFDLTERQAESGPYPVISSGGVNYSTSTPKIEGPGVVTGRKGLLGKVHYSDGPYWPHDTTLWVKDFKGNHPRFIYYWLHSVPLATLDGGAANPTLNRNHAHLLPVRVPDHRTQRIIADVLGAFDDLIENNRRRIAILERMAQAIYREWFVYLRYPGHENVDVVDSPLGEVPSGWDVTELGELVTVQTDSVDPSSVDPNTPAVGLEHIPRKSLTLTEWGRSAGLASRKTRFVRGDVLFGKIRPYFHKVCIAPLDGIASTDTIVARPREDVRGLVAMAMFSDAFVTQAVATSNGTKMPRADWNVLQSWPLTVPPPGLLATFEEVIDDVLELCIDLASQSRELAALRDLLLPKLVSGTIDVSRLKLDERAA